MPTNQNPAIAAAAKEAMKAVTATAAKTTNKLNEKAVADAAPALEAAITKAIAADPVVQNATNTEVWWWQKRSRWSMVVSGVLVIANPAFQYAGIDIDPDTKDFIITALSTVGNLAAGYLALRAGIAVKPLFTPEPRYPLNK